MPAADPSASLPLSVFVFKAEAEHMAFPVLVLPPHAPQSFGPPTGDDWTAKSAAQNRQLDREVTYDPATGAETSRTGFSDKGWIDRIVGTGISWHEGQLLGLANQIIGLATAAGLVATAILGVLMWLRRRPKGELGAPPFTRIGSRPLLFGGVALLAILLPLFGLTLIPVLLAERLLLRGLQGGS